MTDILTPEQRHKNMSRIRGKNTRPELILRRLIYDSGVRGYRIHYNLPGKPDIVFVKKRVVIFIDGCFWHKCPDCFREPQTRRDFWLEKINKNCERDEKNNQILKEEGWNVIRIWEHNIRKQPGELLKEIMEYLGRTEVADGFLHDGGNYTYIRVI
ncbi:MAG TPA: very short patch repair endonuclease [Methanospirillum sp.]|uniref:very short patch repair endonuclease n=1 Tax=Methanospirillum sp. TaxID=45200 RepID=UPI002C3ECCB0|nr:very short patch repair endonuclease [Methanospirillum sp.]HOJ97394.1 very short patch repair endonuclease [Methanospirillum sp.]